VSSKSVTGKVLLTLGRGAVNAAKVMHAANQARHTECAGCKKPSRAATDMVRTCAPKLAGS